MSSHSSHRSASASSSQATSASDADSPDFRVISVSRAQPQNNSPENGQPAHADVSSPASRPGTDALQQWVKDALQAQKNSGVTFSDVVRANRNFQNPAIYEKMISYCEIDQFGTHLPSPIVLEEADFYDQIAKRQEAKMEQAQ